MPRSDGAKGRRCPQLAYFEPQLRVLLSPELREQNAQRGTTTVWLRKHVDAKEEGLPKNTHSLVCALRCFFPECFSFFAGKLRRLLLLPPLFDGSKTMQAQPSQSFGMLRSNQARNYADRCSSAYFNPKEISNISSKKLVAHDCTHRFSHSNVRIESAAPERRASCVQRQCCDLARLQGQELLWLVTEKYFWETLNSSARGVAPLIARVECGGVCTAYISRGRAVGLVGATLRLQALACQCRDP
jgi:hypothetical protein